MQPQLLPIRLRRTSASRARSRRGGLLVATLSAGLMAGLMPSVAAAGSDPVTPTVSVKDHATSESNKGFTSTAPVAVTLSSFAPDATVDYQLISGTAIAGKDFVAATGTVSFASGPSQTIPVKIKGDDKDELDETFRIKLLNPVNATIADGKGVVTILDNDGPLLSVKPPVKVERGPSQHPKLVFQLVLSKPGVETIKVTATPQSGTLSSGEVTLPAARTFTFKPGETVRKITITTTGDHVDEGDETVKLALSGYLNTFGPSMVVGTVRDDDCGGTDPGADDAIVMTAISGDAGSEVRTKSSMLTCNNEVDWYRIDLVESNGGLNDNTPLTAKVRLLVGDNPAQGGGDLDLCVYRRTFADADALVACSTNSGLADELVQLKQDDSFVGDDSRTVWIAVRRHGTILGPNSYELKVAGHVAVSVGDNL
jgi:hypothetical protein